MSKCADLVHFSEKPKSPPVLLMLEVTLGGLELSLLLLLAASLAWLLDLCLLDLLVCGLSTTPVGACTSTLNLAVAVTRVVCWLGVEQREDDEA